MVNAKDERRRDERAPIAVRVRINGLDPNGTPWDEYATTADVSLRGARIPMQHPVERGQVLRLQLPLPARFRRYDPDAPLYRVYALVRHVCAASEGLQKVGLRFLGKEAPRDYEKYPACRYFLPGEPLPAGPSPHQPLSDEETANAAQAQAGVPAEERRRARRLDLFTEFRIQRLAPATDSERTVAENIGHGGARVLTSLSIQPGEILRIEEVDGTFATRAEVVNAYVGANQTLRLNLRFLDAKLPKRLLPD
jgi:hypothetical protein